MFGIGTDIVEIARVEHWPAEAEMLCLVFTRSEKDAAMTRKYPAKYFAAVFAVKEAFMKAAGTGWGEGIQWKDIEVSNAINGWGMKLHNRAAELCEAKRVFVSASCSRDHAVAMVVIE